MHMMLRLILASVFVVGAVGQSFANMHHFRIEETAPLVPMENGTAKDNAAYKYGGGDFRVTATADCFGKLGKHETMQVRKTYANPWKECQRRIEARQKLVMDNKKQETAKTVNAEAVARADQGEGE